MPESVERNQDGHTDRVSRSTENIELEPVAKAANHWSNAKGGEEEDSDAQAIRDQVEYYFSDENLPHDRHVLECCAGRLNRPVSLNRICGFKKMRGFRPKSKVVAALRNSAFLNVTEDGKHVSRKVPLQGWNLLDADDSDDSDIAHDPSSEPPMTKKKEKIIPPPPGKKIVPPGMTKKMMEPTGFEETYTEVITPAEYEVEQSIYDPETAFVERIEVAIQRFKQKRKMHQMYAHVFSKWMKYGGVDSAPRQFTGKLSQAEMDDMDAGEIARMLATHQVDWSREDRKKWVVDFKGVAEGFFASFFPTEWPSNSETVKTATKVLRSFYNYIIHHNVCPEYENDILAARAVCDKAEVELIAVRKASLELPGAFNVAASTLFEGYHAGLYAGDASWTITNDSWAGDDTTTIGMKREEAFVVFKTGVVVYGTDAQYDMLENGGFDAIKVTGEEDIGLCITAIEPANQDTLDIYKSQNEMWKHKLALLPLGRLHCETWEIPSFDDWDLPPSFTTASKTTEKRQYTFWVEDLVLKDSFVGMKLEARIRHLSCGITILDDVRQVYCSFFKWLPNEMVFDSRLLKEVRYLKPREAETAEGKESREGTKEGWADNEVETEDKIEQRGEAVEAKVDSGAGNGKPGDDREDKDEKMETMVFEHVKPKADKRESTL